MEPPTSYVTNPVWKTYGRHLPAFWLIIFHYITALPLHLISASPACFDDAALINRWWEKASTEIWGEKWNRGEEWLRANIITQTSQPSSFKQMSGASDEENLACLLFSIHGEESKWEGCWRVSAAPFLSILTSKQDDLCCRCQSLTVWGTHQRLICTLRVYYTQGRALRCSLLPPAVYLRTCNTQVQWRTAIQGWLQWWMALGAHPLSLFLMSDASKHPGTSHLMRNN